jgi:hypothetical protein
MVFYNLNDLAKMGVFTRSGTGVEVVVIQAQAAAFRTSGFSLRENGTFIQIKEFIGPYRERRFARMVEKKNSRALFVKTRLVSYNEYIIVAQEVIS